MALNIYAETAKIDLKNKKIREEKTMFPKLKDVEKALKEIKKHEIDPDISELDVTLAWLDKEKNYNFESEAFDPGYDKKIASQDWVIQIGDNSFMGRAYFFEHWAIGVIGRRTNCRELAKDLIRELQDLYYQ